VTIAGDWSWKPHPTCSPAERQRQQQARERDEREHHARGESDAGMRIDPRVAVPGAASDSAFSERIGNTQGIRLRMRPPTNARATAAANVVLAAGAGVDVQHRRGRQPGFGSRDDGARERNVDRRGARRVARHAETFARDEHAGEAAEFAALLSSTPGASAPGRRRRRARALRRRRLDARIVLRKKCSVPGIRCARRGASASRIVAPSPGRVDLPAVERGRGSAARVRRCAAPTRRDRPRGRPPPAAPA
jgi:hypothetical protein